MMMRSILLLNLIATTASMTQDNASDHPPLTNDDNNNKRKTVGLRGLTRSESERRKKKEAFADLLEAMWKDEDDDTDTDIILELEEEGAQDDMIAILLDGESEDELITSLIKDRREKIPKKKKSGKEKLGKPKSSLTVKWVEKPNDKERQKKKEPRKKGASSVDVVGEETEKETRTTISMEPTPSSTFGFPTLYPTSMTIVMDEDPSTLPAPGSLTDQLTRKSATDRPTTQPTLAVDPKMTSVALPCPPHYSTVTTYTAGDTIEHGLDIYQCQSSPYEEYCNIIELDETWNDSEKALWSDAWVHVSACEKLLVEEDMTEARDDAEVAGGATEAPITTEATTSTTTMAEVPITTTVATTSTTTTAEAPITTETAHGQPCPSAYDPFKTNYIAGDQTTVKCFIFQCRDEEHEAYCNVAVWDESLLAQNDRAQEIWIDAWEELGACVPTQEDLMDEEAANPGGAWDCLA